MSSSRIPLSASSSSPVTKRRSSRTSKKPKYTDDSDVEMDEHDEDYAESEQKSLQASYSGTICSKAYHDSSKASERDIDIFESTFDITEPTKKTGILGKSRLNIFGARRQENAWNSTIETGHPTSPKTTEGHWAPESNTVCDRPEGHSKKYEDNLRMKNGTFQIKNGIVTELAPLSRISDIFGHMTEKVLQLGFENVLSFLSCRPLHIGTMCSGTEAPILGLDMILQHLKKLGRSDLPHVKHLFSAEIVAWKQHYIQTNFEPPLIFRDIVNLLSKKNEHGNFVAKTAHGGEAVVPGDLDMLIAGFSCVDFSGLNNNPKSLEDEGESGDTLKAIIEYAQELRPKLIILENVQNCFWVDDERRRGESVERRFKKISYRSAFTLLDTKRYYLPHTRSRGYMLLVDEKLFDSPGLLGSKLSKYKELVAQLESPASAPVEAFLLKSDDQMLRDRSEEGVGRIAKRHEWISCEKGYGYYRDDLLLGDQRPITHWDRGTSTRNPDFHIPLLEQTDRVSDTLDISHLRNVLRGFDDRYYSRSIDFSQNVYRVPDISKNGIIGCLTPSGLPYNTARGGKILGYEAMKLQGLPVEQLDLSQLSDSQLRNLAGNAMTSTVVGATILASLTVFYEVLNLEGREKVVEQPLVPLLADEALLKRKLSDPTNYRQVKVEELIVLASLSTKLCYCEGQLESANTSFLMCRHCKHTACKGCGKNPKHDYEPINPRIINKRIKPVEFGVRIKELIPMKISFSNVFELDSCLTQFKNAYQYEDTKELAASFIQKALTADVYYQRCHRREAWVAEFESNDSKLLLTVSQHCLQWQLHVKVPGTLAGNHPLRLHFEKYPIAELTPKPEACIAEGEWKFWVPQLREFPATIISSGTLVKSFHASIGLGEHVGEKVFSKINLDFKSVDEEEDKYLFPEEIRGEYIYYPGCGQPFNSMHIKANLKKGEGNLPLRPPPPICLFFDHEYQTGDPTSHSFVLSLINRRLEFQESRPCLARLTNSWRQPVVDKIGDDHHICKTTVIVDGRWIQLPGFGIRPSEGRQFAYNHLPNPISSEQDLVCSLPLAALTCELKISNSKPGVPMGKWVEVNQSNEHQFFQDFGWMLENGKIMEGYGFENLKNVDEWQTATVAKNFRCSHCSPESPPLLWSYEKRAKGNSKRKQIPYEEPDAATAFEKALKLRPSGISIVYRIDQEGTLKIKVGLNPATLIHRALAALDPEAACSTIAASWCFVSDDNMSRRTTCSPFKLKSTEDENLANQPSGFSPRHALRPEQLRKLSWMIKQDKGVSFTEREFIEARDTLIGYLLIGQAQHQRIVRGGILADEVGFGKTILILALTLCRLKADETFASQDISGLIPIKATIVFVPAQLPKQWKSEAEDFLAATPNGSILIIENVCQLAKLTIKDFQNASLVVVSSAVPQNKVYRAALAHLTAMVEPASTASSRAKSTWHKTARESMEQTVEKMKSSPANICDFLESKYQINKKESKGKELPVPSKRLTGQKYQDHNKKRKRDKLNDETSEREPEDPSEEPTEYESTHNLENLGEQGYESLVFPMLEMFGYARVVVDELTYVDTSESTTMMNLVANSYWALSGTPPVKDFSSAKTLAEFLHVHLGAEDYAHMKRDIYKKKVADMTASEKLLTFQGVISPALEERRNAQATAFMEIFVRRDFPKTELIEHSSLVRLVDQPIFEAALYWELEHALVANGFRLSPKLFSRTGWDKHFNEALTKSSGREALMFRASYSSILPEDANLRTPPDTALEAFRYSGKTRAIQRKAVKAEFARLVDAAAWLYHNPADEEKGDNKHTEDGNIKLSFKTFLRGISENDLGDLLVTKELSNISNIGLQEYHHDNKSQIQDLIQDQTLKTITTKLRKLARDLVSRTRSLRFFDSIFQISQNHAKCDCCVTVHDEKPVLPKDWVVLSSCGHLLCTASCAQLSTDDCPVEGCACPFEPSGLLSGDYIPKNQEDHVYYPFGEKLRQITELINDDKLKDDQVLLFVQSDALREKIVAALKFEDISYIDLKTNCARSNLLNQFQNSVRGKRYKVLVLNIGDESAAGSNLTMANHVIFVAPYLTLGSDAQQIYSAARTQAVGRALRFGQKKVVHIYDFVTANTIDVDVFERRTNKFVEVIPSKTEIGKNDLVLLDRKHGQQSIYGSLISGLIFPEDGLDNLSSSEIEDTI